jgi:hypothetical protein
MNQNMLTLPPNFLVMAKTAMKTEKQKNGLRLRCSGTKQDIDCITTQYKNNYGGLLTCYCLLNGITIATFNLCCGNTSYETAGEGCTFNCITGDPACQNVLTTCCDCIDACLKAGGCCVICCNGQPLCTCFQG